MAWFVLACGVLLWAVMGPLLWIQVREERRAKAVEALKVLWHAMGLYNGRPGIRLPSHTYSYKDSERLFWYFGESILGDGCPEGEQLC